MMEAAKSSETMVNFYQTTRRYNPEDSLLRTNRRENLKSYYVPKIIFHERIIESCTLLYKCTSFKTKQQKRRLRVTASQLSNKYK
jgi:hypothetical protein